MHLIGHSEFENVQGYITMQLERVLAMGVISMLNMQPRRCRGVSAPNRCAQQIGSRMERAAREAGRARRASLKSLASYCAPSMRRRSSSP